MIDAVAKDPECQGQGYANPPPSPDHVASIELTRQGSVIQALARCYGNKQRCAGAPLASIGFVPLPCAHIDYGSIIHSVIHLRSLKLARTNFSPRSGPVQGRTEIFVDNCARVLNRAIMHWTFTWAACPANGACSWLAERSHTPRAVRKGTAGNLCGPTVAPTSRL